MANRRDDDHLINNEVEESVLTRAKFIKFCEENQQVMCDLQQGVAALLARNPNHDGHGERNNRNMHEPLIYGYNNRNRPLAYDEDYNEDDEYEEHVHEGYCGLVREHARDYQEYCMKMKLPYFNGDVTI